jgi:hypothetical protein
LDARTLAIGENFANGKWPAVTERGRDHFDHAERT